MLSVPRFAEHNSRIEEQRKGRTGLLAGHKKDVVLSQRLAARPKQVAIYGWHTIQGTPIQPLSLIHENTYADYSHGIRLVSATALLDGVPVSLAGVLASNHLASYLSTEGPLTVLRVPGVVAPTTQATTPETPTSSGGSLGLRALAMAKKELAQPGWESPPGSHAGPRIAAYFAPCQRNGKPLLITSGNWCAAFASFCEARAARPDEVGPHSYRAAVAELWADALQNSAAFRVSTGYQPRPGDLAIFGRKGQDPTKGGAGHVGRVIGEVDASGRYSTIEGNHDGMVAIVDTRTVKETIGWIAYPGEDGPAGVVTEEDLESAAGILDASPTDEPEEPSSGPERLPRANTAVTAMEMYKALLQAWKKLFNTTPHRTSLLVLLSQWALETGRGKATHEYNVGNLKSSEGDGHDYTFFACDEIVGGKMVRFLPDDPGCRFRAYRTLALGVADYLGTLHARFKGAWPAVLAGSPEEFAHRLKVQKRYTASEAQYTKTIVSLFNQYSATIPLDQVDGDEPSPDMETTGGLQMALQKLGFLPLQPIQEELAPVAIAALLAFQAANGLEVDGVVGPDTRVALARALSDSEE